MEYARSIAGNWSSIAIRGVLAILTGLVMLALPGVAVGALVLLFGVYALLDGILSLTAAWRASKAHERWGPLALEGIAGIIVAVMAVAWPAITAVALVYLVAAWALVTGFLEIAAAISLRKYITGEWLLALAGVLSILFGIALIVAPVAGALAIAIWMGIYALIFGATMVALGFRIRSWTRRSTPGHGSEQYARS